MVQTASGTLSSVTNNELATDRSSRRRSAGGTRPWPGRWIPPGCGPRAGCSASSTPPPSSSTPDPGRDFTVQEVVERSGQSLHSFYQYFGGKHELLLALFEERVRSTTEHLAARIAEETTRSSASTASWWSTTACAVRPRASRYQEDGDPSGMAEFAQQLLTEHPKEAARVFVPLLSLFEEVLAGGGRRRRGATRAPPRARSSASCSR